MSKLSLISIILLLVLKLSCGTENTNEGYVDVEGGEIWYKVVGDGDGTPLLVLHGGPGSRSCAMIPGLSLLSKQRPVIFYDQLGGGHSNGTTDSTLWNISRFVDEIDHLRNKLELDELHILGHSAGSAFLIEYMATKKPKGVKSVIFSSPLLSTPDWIKDAKYLLAQMPLPLQDTINKYEALGNYFAPSYLAATDSFYSRHLQRKRINNSVRKACRDVPLGNSEIYNYMWGPTEFNATGTLIDFDRTKYIAKIEEPILFVTGEFDEARPETMYRYQKLAKNASVRVIPNAAHITMADEPEKLKDVINDFLNKVENSFLNKAQ